MEPAAKMLRGMNSARPTFLSITITFVAALIFYIAAYSWLTKRQTGKGPWHVVFTNDVSGTPELIVSQGTLAITNTHIRFEGESLSKTQSTGVVEFRKPKMAVPFGELIFDDLMFQPGTVTLDCFGHEVELLPRALVLDRKQTAWLSHSTNVLVPSGKLPPEARKQKGGYRK